MRRSRRIAAAFAAAIVVLAALEIALPRAFEARIERELGRVFQEARLVRASLESFPAAALLWGRIDRIHLDLRRVAVSGLTVDAVLVDGEDLVVDMPKLLRGEGVEIEDAGALRATLVISEEDLNEYFWSRVENRRSFRVSLERGQAVLAGSLTLLGRELDVRVSGSFRVAGPTSVAFVPEQVSVDGAPVPQFLVDWVASEWQLVLDLGGAPFEVAIEQLWIEDGELLVYGARPRRG